MSWFDIEDFAKVDGPSTDLMNHFNTHCSWCSAHRSDNCKSCMKAFGKVYRPLRIKELRIKHGFLGSQG